MTASRTRWSRWGSGTSIALAASLTVAACGVPTGGETRRIESSAVPYGLLRDRDQSIVRATGEGVAPGEIRGRIGLLGGDSAVRLVERDVATGSPAAVAGLLLKELQRGPTDAERRFGLDSAVSPEARLRVTGWRRDVLTVDVSGELTAAPERLPLAVAQIVLTVTSVPSVRAVQFQHDGTVVQVPLGDGSLTSAALTRQDYQNLLQASPAPTTSERGP